MKTQTQVTLYMRIVIRHWDTVKIVRLIYIAYMYSQKIKHLFIRIRLWGQSPLLFLDALLFKAVSPLHNIHSIIIGDHWRPAWRKPRRYLVVILNRVWAEKTFWSRRGYRLTFSFLEIGNTKTLFKSLHCLHWIYWFISIVMLIESVTINFR